LPVGKLSLRQRKVLIERIQAILRQRLALVAASALL
jgi:hypothetical protein